MAEQEANRLNLLLLRRIVVEILIWLTLPAAFLLAYTGIFHQPTSSVAPHLGLLLWGWVSVGWLRVQAFRRWPGSPLPLTLSALGLGLIALSTTLYYAIVLIGISYWNHVITWDLIRAYTPQLPATAQALDISVAALLAAVFLLFIVQTTLIRYALGHWDWTPLVAEHFTSRFHLRTPPLILIGTISITSLVLGGSLSKMGEPLSLTISPPHGQYQNHVIDASVKIENGIRDFRARTDYSPSGKTPTRNVILFVVDGLRPDHLGILGYHRNTTPNLSKLASMADQYYATAGVSSCSESLCGLMAIAASNYVHRLSDTPLTLQEVLRVHGYNVIMLLAGDHTNFYGLRDLYGEVDLFVDGTSNADYMNDDLLLLQSLADLPAWSGRPTMLQFHLMSAHLLSGRGEDPAYTPSSRYGVMGSTATGDGIVRSEPVVNFYDNGVIQADNVIGVIFDRLVELGYTSDAVLLVTSDHGEALGEHGIFGHAKSVRGPGLNIPILYYDFGGGTAEPIEPRRMISLIDLAPSIVHDLGIPIPDSWAGSPIQGAVQRNYTLFQQGHEVGLIDHREGSGTWKFWLHLRTGDTFLYRLDVEPREGCNLADQAPEELVEAWLGILRSESMAATQRRTTDRTIRNEASSSEDCSLLDPKADGFWPSPLSD